MTKINLNIKNMAKNIKVQGFILVDVDAVALNNAGKNETTNFDNAVSTKRIRKNGKTYTYVSGQAFRSWWRDTLQKNQGWELSPISREDKIAYTCTNPLKYADDDVFGYMKAAKEEVTGDNGRKKTQNITVTRVSPLKNSVLISVAPVSVAENWSSMARQEGDSVPYVKQEYSAVMKGMFSIDASMVGTFSDYNKTGFMNLSDALKKEAIERYNCLEIEDAFYKEKKLIQMPAKTRIQRCVDTIKALKTISGGAMQTNNMGDVTPKFIILATTTTGNHPFSHVATTEGIKDEIAKLNVVAIKEIIDEYKDTFVGKIFIGKRSGFFDEYNNELKDLAESNDYKDLIVLAPVNDAIDKYCEQLSKQIE